MSYKIPNEPLPKDKNTDFITYEFNHIYKKPF